MINILITGSGGGLAQGIIKSLKMIKDLEIRIITTDSDPLATGLYAGDKSYIVPKFSDLNYSGYITNIFKKENIKFFIPGTDFDLEFSSINKKKFKKDFNIITIVSNIDTLRIANDKYKTYEHLKENNLNYPKTFLKSEIKNMDLSYPLIFKPAIGSRSIGVKIVNNYEELAYEISRNDNNNIIQELIGNQENEFTSTIVKINDEISDVLILKRYLRSGDTYKAEPIKSEIISNYVKKIANSLDIYGPCNFQLRTDDDGTPKVFEINCRFSGTTPFCSQLGFNPVESVIKNALNIDYKYSIQYEKQILRYWSEILIEKNDVTKLKKKKNLHPRYIKKIDLF